ncbi:tyrosine-type recombinase/integrase [Lutibacter sp.]
MGRKFQPYQKLFLVYTNQSTNRHLKDIAKECKIETKISFHLSRHPFGTHGTSFGIPEKLLMEMMGHKDLKVSRMYSKIQDEALVKSMVDNWISE